MTPSTRFVFKMLKTLQKLLKDKKARFVDFTRSLTVGNFFFFVVMSLVMVFVISWLINSVFPSVSVVKVGTPFKFIIVAAGLTLSFYIITRRQGGLDRSDIFAILLLGGAMIALFIYMPKLLPEIFSTVPILQYESNPFSTFYNVSLTIHQGVQSVVPIP